MTGQMGLFEEREDGAQATMTWATFAEEDPGEIMDRSYEQILAEEAGLDLGLEEEEEPEPLTDVTGVMAAASKATMRALFRKDMGLILTIWRGPVVDALFAFYVIGGKDLAMRAHELAVLAIKMD